MDRRNDAFITPRVSARHRDLLRQTTSVRGALRHLCKGRIGAGNEFPAKIFLLFANVGMVEVERTVLFCARTDSVRRWVQSAVLSGYYRYRSPCPLVEFDSRHPAFLPSRWFPSCFLFISSCSAPRRPPWSYVGAKGSWNRSYPLISVSHPFSPVLACGP